ncbi:MAG: BrnA antitoxin family protein [Alphaproteobacteria bacterium]|nr:BrnA antitoxin family protein [Alphaproteobacteria bacterium]
MPIFTNFHFRATGPGWQTRIDSVLKKIRRLLIPFPPKIKGSSANPFSAPLLKAWG